MNNSDRIVEKQNSKPKMITKKVSCNGGSETSGHPLIYLKYSSGGFVKCPYCQKEFSNKTPNT